MGAGKYALTQTYVIELDGTLAGRLMSVNALLPRAETVTEAGGFGRIQHKHIASVAVPESSFTCGAGMSRAFYDWIKASLEDNPTRKSAAFVSVTEKNERGPGWEFRNALISEVVFPTLDAASKENARFTIKIAPEMAQIVGAASGKVDLPARGKLWGTSNFRLSIDGLESACKYVTHIEPVSTKFKTILDDVGQTRSPQRLPMTTEYSNLEFKLPVKHADDLIAWHKKFVIEGNTRQSDEKSGALEYLDPSTNFTYFRVDFKNLGIMELQISGGDALVTMYCEDMDFSYETKATL